MSEISEIEIKSMTKEQNYMRGYEDGKSDVLAKIRAEIETLPIAFTSSFEMKQNCLDIIDKNKGESEDKA